MATDRDGGEFPKFVAHESGSGGMDLHASNPCINITCLEVTIYELSKMLPVQKSYKPTRWFL